MKKNKLLDNIFLGLISFQTILMGILFIIQVLRIYIGNKKVFTRDICGKYIIEMLPVIIIWICMVIGGFVYFKIKGNFKEKYSKVPYTTKLLNIEKIYNVSDNQVEYSLKIKEEKNKRKIIKIVNIVIICVCCVMSIGYLSNIKHFDASNGKEHAKQAGLMALHLMPWVIISFISSIVCVFLEEYSAKKSIELIKATIDSKSRNIYLSQIKKNEFVLNIVKGAILALSVVLIIVGIATGGATTVLDKAKVICTECIGLG